MRAILSRVVVALVAAGVVILTAAAPADACGGLVGPNGAVRLLRTSTLAAYAGGFEHYITSFEFAGGGAEFGSIIPLPGIPSNVERGGDWTLQRLDRETTPQAQFAAAGAAASSDGRSAEVIQETRIDALDITILRGGAQEVGTWAKDHGFQLTPDAPEVLAFYAHRSPIFMAARFDAQVARDRGQGVGDGTPIHLTIPVQNPWVPLRILGLGRGGREAIDADVYLLTERRAALLPAAGPGLSLEHDAAATTQLLDDLRSDKGMAWVPEHMHLMKLRVAQAAETLRFDLAVDASGRGRPSYRMAGLTPPAPPPTRPPAATTTAPPPPTTTALERAGADGPSEALPARPAGSSGAPVAGLATVAAALCVMVGIGLVVRRWAWR